MISVILLPNYKTLMQMNSTVMMKILCLIMYVMLSCLKPWSLSSTSIWDFYRDLSSLFSCCRECYSYLQPGELSPQILQTNKMQPILAKLLFDVKACNFTSCLKFLIIYRCENAWLRILGTLLGAIAWYSLPTGVYL